MTELAGYIAGLQPRALSASSGSLPGSHVIQGYKDVEPMQQNTSPSSSSISNQRVTPPTQSTSSTLDAIVRRLIDARRAPLDPTELARFNAYCQRDNADEVLAEWFNIPLTVGTLRRFRPGLDTNRWLNDEVNI